MSFISRKRAKDLIVYSFRSLALGAMLLVILLPVVAVAAAILTALKRDPAVILPAVKLLAVIAELYMTMLLAFSSICLLIAAGRLVRIPLCRTRWWVTLLLVLILQLSPTTTLLLGS